MQDDQLLKNNPGFDASAKVLTKYFERNIDIEPTLSTDSMQRELGIVVNDFEELLNAEAIGDFPMVQDKFRVIDNDTILVVPDTDLQRRILDGKCDWRDVQKKSVAVHRDYAKKYQLERLVGNDLYAWNLGYDMCIGIMKGVLDYLKFESSFLSY